MAGWRGGQIASVAAGLALAVLALRSRPSVPAVLAALVAVSGGVALAWWPVAGRTGEEWLPTVTRWVVGGGGRTVQRAGVAASGQRVGAGTRRPSVTVVGLPTSRRRAGPSKALAGLAIVAVGRAAAGPVVGVVRDGRARTFTAVLALRGHNFALLGADEKDRRVGGWSAVLASLARERSVVHRLQWLAVALPDDGAAVAGHLAERAVLGPDEPARRSYASVLETAGADTCRHEVLLAVQVRAVGTAARAARAAGGGDTGTCAVLLREVESLRRQLEEVDVTVDGVLDPWALAHVVRRAGDPKPAGRARAGSPAPGGPGVRGAAGAVATAGVAWPWPMASAAAWDCLRTDGTWHATYWIAEWPRVDVGADFLGPLLLSPVRRSVAVTMEPVTPGRAVRQAEQARTADVADAELRRRGGFLATARRAREEEVAMRREEELADGHASFRFSGYVTVTATSRDRLARACDATEHAAGQCRIELRRLYGDQERAFTCTLPLGRGLT